jgi:hypothetical protein
VYEALFGLQDLFEALLQITLKHAETEDDTGDTTEEHELGTDDKVAAAAPPQGWPRRSPATTT